MCNVVSSWTLEVHETNAEKNNNVNKITHNLFLTNSVGNKSVNHINITENEEQLF